MAREKMLLFVFAIFLALLTPVAAASDGGQQRCQSSSTKQFFCPSRAETCGSDNLVLDCLGDCPGFLHPDDGNRVCIDRRLFRTEKTKIDGDTTLRSSFLWNDLVGLSVWFGAAGVATACGVGGGGIYVPLGILLLQMQPKTSSGLSQASIFGASLGGLLLNARNVHPHPQSKRPLIDYDMALFLAPMEMAGAVLGVLIQTILPNWLYLLLAAIILAGTAYKTFGKYRSTRNTERENEGGNEDEPATNVENGDDKPESNVNNNGENNDDDKEEEHAGATSSDGEEMASNNESERNASDPLRTPKEEYHSCTDTGNGNGTSNEEPTTTPPQSESDQAILTRLLEEDARQYPRDKILALVLLWIGLVLLTFFKGGKGVDSIIGITCASPWYAVLIAIQFVWTFGFAIVSGWKLVIRQKKKTRVSYPTLENDVIWDVAKLRFYAAFTFLAGIVAGLIGIGGGMVLGPLMLVMGIHPRVSSATTATMIVLTSSSVAVLFVTSGLVPWDYALAFFGTCFLGAIVGKTQIDGYVTKTGRASLLILLLAVIIALATIGCLVIVFLRLNEADWCFAGFHKFCDVSKDDEGGDAIECGLDRMLMRFDDSGT